jgi:hypothetical protein
VQLLLLLSFDCLLDPRRLKGVAMETELLILVLLIGATVIAQLIFSCFDLRKH